MFCFKSLLVLLTSWSWFWISSSKFLDQSAVFFWVSPEILSMSISDWSLSFLNSSSIFLTFFKFSFLIDSYSIETYISLSLFFILWSLSLRSYFSIFCPSNLFKRTDDSFIASEIFLFWFILILTVSFYKFNEF